MGNLYQWLIVLVIYVAISAAIVVGLTMIARASLTRRARNKTRDSKPK